MKRFLIFLIMCLLAVSVDAQTKKRKSDTINICEPGHYLIADIGGGLQSLTYKLPENGLFKPGMGLMVRGGYRYFFNKNWGVGTELNFKTQSSSGIVNFTQTIDGADDHDEFHPDHTTYRHITLFNNLKERQKQMILSIPVGGYYQYRIDKQWKVGGGAGAYFQFTDLSNKYVIKKGNIETKGYYEEYNCYFERMSQHQFYKRDDLKGTNTKHSCWGLYLEGNVLYYLTPRLSVDLGLQINKAMGYQKESESKMLFDPDCLPGGSYDDHYNGILQSDLVKKSNPLAIGVMAGVRYKLNFNRQPRIKDDDKPRPPRDTIPMKLDSLPPAIIAENEPDDVVNVLDSLSKDNPVIADVPSETVPLVPNLPDVPDVPETDSITEPLLVVDTDKPEEVDIDYTKFKRISVTFLFNDTIVHLNPAQIKMFDDIAKLMNQQEELTIKLVGHTCNIGTWEQNIYVGQKRAEFCKMQLMERGISGDRISCDSKAYSQPLVPNTNEANRRKNRRIEFIIR